MIDSTSFLILFLFPFFLYTQIPEGKQVISSLYIYNLDTGKSTLILEEKRHFEALNWSRDGKYLLINAKGKLEKVSIEGEKLGELDTDFAQEANNDHGFSFDWTKEKINHVFKIIKETEGESKNQEIHGLISIKDIAAEFRIHINLVEISNDNKSPNKKIDRVAGCLLSFAVQIAFEKGYYGFTSLIPKTKLIPLYVEKYGFSQYGRQLAIEGKEAIKLIQEYQ